MGCATSSSRNKESGGDFDDENVAKEISGDVIADNYANLGEVQHALRIQGLESSNLIVGIDFTKSNTWTGTTSFNGRSLHSFDPRVAAIWSQKSPSGKFEPGCVAPPAYGEEPANAPVQMSSIGVELPDRFDLEIMNPYEIAIGIIGKTLEVFDDDHLIPVYGFGDSKTSDKAVFPIGGNGTGICHGFGDVLAQYQSIVPSIILAGPTSFAPLIYQAISIVKQSPGYHILLIIADGQVTNIAATTNAIIEAANYPISIIMIGVGDGPFDQMMLYDDMPGRKFDNFQFVNLTEIVNKYAKGEIKNLEPSFAWRALMELPDQYKLIRGLNLL